MDQLIVLGEKDLTISDACIVVEPIGIVANLSRIYTAITALDVLTVGATVVTCARGIAFFASVNDAIAALNECAR